MNSLNAFKFFVLFLAISLFVSCQKNQPPTCEIVKPDNGSEFSRGDVISVSVDTDDPDGIVAEVRLYVNGSGLTGLSFPYNYDLITDEYAPGQYTLKVTAWDNEGLEASDEVVVTISVAQSQVTTTAADSITYNSAAVGGSVSNDGGNAITEAGIYWDTVTNPETAGTRVPMAEDLGDFFETIYDLPHGTRIYFRAYAINSAGLALGQELEFQTHTVPTVQTGSIVDSITHESAVVRGEVTDDGGEEIIENGFYWGSEPSPEITGTRTVSAHKYDDFFAKLMGLSPATTYYVKAFSVNAAGESVGNEISFTTKGGPVVVTGSVVSVKYKSAVVGGEVTDNGGITITETGFYWGDSPDPESSGSKLQVGEGIGAFTGSFTDLVPGTTYYYRAYALNVAGESLGEELIFELAEIESGTFFDARDNVEYGMVTIGEQVWMAENLRATKYNDASEIPHLPDSLSWTYNDGPGYCWYENDTMYRSWGALYTWEAVNTGLLCPSGWHVSSDQEWKQLEIYLGMNETEADQTGFRGTAEGGMMKATGLWESPNTGATNETLMTIMPTGSRSPHAGFESMGWEAHIWTSDQESELKAFARYWRYNHSEIYRSSEYKGSGFNVRCVKD